VAAIGRGWGSLRRMPLADPRPDRRDRPDGSRGAPWLPDDDPEGRPTGDPAGRSADRDGGNPDRVERVAAWLRATPAELAGLAILLVGAAVASLLLWWGATGRPTELAPGDPALGAAAAGEEAGSAADGADNGLASGVTGATAGPTGDTAPAATPSGASDGVPPPAPEVPGSVTVHVSGAVQRPGLVELPAGSRVGHAVEAAGGFGPGADLATVNLARLLTDGEQVHVLREGEAPPPAGGAAPAAGAPTGEGAAPPGAEALPGSASHGGGIDAEGRVDLNRATAAELETLPGIGPAKAAAIVEHRETHGPFAEPGDIRAVSGIGEKTFQQLADRITIG
jgi:competence protein ComEA